MIHLTNSSIYDTIGIKPPNGILLHGPAGTGKTLLAKATCGQLGINMIEILTSELISDRSGGSEKNIQQLFETAGEQTPCIIFLDEIDSICGSRDESNREMTSRIIATFSQQMDNMPPGVLLLAASNRPESIDQSLRRTGRFDSEIIVGIPTEVEREYIIRKVCSNLKLEENFNYFQLARNTPGYVAADLVALAREAASFAIDRIAVDQNSTDVQSGWRRWSELKLNEDELDNISIKFEDFIAGLKRIVPSAKREGFATVPDVTWNDVGALEMIREELSLAILAPIKNPIQFAKLGLSRPSGILLTGPPGCGKTLVAKAIANESGLNFISGRTKNLPYFYNRKTFSSKFDFSKGTGIVEYVCGRI